ncbi:transcription initiation factor TFIID subunit 4 [Salminus brasiliensis]|uniref:transcription initiation factor TFIID subunit 4 n=1 Tax=Salminus brasiliensis TaxID=930266 RepID=UPI003B82E329
MSDNESTGAKVQLQDPSRGSCNEATASDAPGAKAAANPQVSAERTVGSVCTARAPSASHTSHTKDENNNPSPQPHELPKEEPAKPSSMLSKPAVTLAAVSSTLSSVPSVPSVPKIIVSTAAVRSSAPLVVGARVVQAPTAPSMAAMQGLGALAAHPGGVAVTPNQAGGPTMTPAPVQGAVMALPRTSTLQQTVTVARSPQTTSFQLPANFHIPQGMVLIRSDSGQLMLVSQQALAQAQAQGLVPKPPGISTTIRPQVSQASATATSIIRVSIPPSSANVATIIKPAPATGAAIVKPTSTTGTTIIKPSSMPASTVIKPTAVLATASVKPSSTTGTTVIKATAAQKPPSSTSTANLHQRPMSGTTVSSTSVVKSIAKASPSVTQTIRTGGNAPRVISPNIPATKQGPTKSSAPITVTAETLENVKKCKNFLVTLMKLASSGTRSANMAQNVRALVKDLLDGQLEAEEFTEKLYMELKSSPQPYLVPFLKRSLPAVRQLTPNPQLFIQQCDQPKPPSSASSALSSTSQKHSLPSCTVPQPLRGSVTVRPSYPVIQQVKGVPVKHPVTFLSRADLAVQKPKQLVIQTNTQPAGAFGKRDSLQASKAPCSVPPPATRAHSFKDSTPGSFRDDDDINDVASMAGVNVSEENARILASSAELVGSVVHSCRDEPFLLTPTLQQRVLHIGSSQGVVEVSPDVLGLLSHATQERLRDLLEKLTAIAQHRNISYRDDWRHIQTTDTRSQLKFLEQLEKVEKRRREEEERETLLCIAKTRSSSEDPEQLRLKQRAKEMQQLELAQMQHREANLAALAALGPRKRKPLEASGPGANQVMSLYAQRAGQRAPVRVTFRDLIFCMEQDPTLRHSRMLYNAYLR